MKKVTKFLKSFVLPTKIGDYRDVSVFLSLVVFLVCLLVAIGPSNFSAKPMIKKSLPNYLIFNEMYNIDDEGKTQFDQLMISTDDTGAVSVFKFNRFEDNQYLGEKDLLDPTVAERTYNYQLKVKDSDQKYNLTVCLAPQYYVDESNPGNLLFDFQGYYYDKPEDGECNVLLIFTKYYVFYLYNNGIYSVDGSRYLESETHNIYETDEAGNPIYYYPNDSIEAMSINEYGNPDVTKWTKIENITADYRDEALDELLIDDPDKSSTYTTLYGDDGIKPMRKLKSLYAVFENTMGYLSYYNLAEGGFDIGVFDINSSATAVGFGDVLVTRYVTAVKSYNYLYSFLYIIILPLIWILVVWLFSKRNGELTYFREYYNVAAFSFVLPSIIIGIFSFFLPYYLIAIYGMVLQIAFFVFVTFRINMVSLKTKKKEASNNQTIDVPHSVETTPLSKYENESKTGRIG